MMQISKNRYYYSPIQNFLMEMTPSSIADDYILIIDQEWKKVPPFYLKKRKISYYYNYIHTNDKRFNYS